MPERMRHLRAAKKFFRNYQTGNIAKRKLEFYTRSEQIDPASTEASENTALPRDIEERKRYQHRVYLDLLKRSEDMTPEWQAYGRKHADDIAKLISS